MRRNKYNARPTEYRGWLFGSKLEAEQAAELDVLQGCGKIRWWLRQVPLDLTEDDRYKLDFLVCDDVGNVYGLETKGYETPSWKRTKKLLMKYAPFEIKVVFKNKTILIEPECT